MLSSKTLKQGKGHLQKKKKNESEINLSHLLDYFVIAKTNEKI
jgi:phosphopantetheinyl transferase